MDDSTWNTEDGLARWRTFVRTPAYKPHMSYCQCADCRTARGEEPVPLEEQIQAGKSDSPRHERPTVTGLILIRSRSDG